VFSPPFSGGRPEINFTSGPSGCTSGDSSYEYLLLVQQWPATQHSSTWPAGADTNDFSLHGLWPSRTGADVNSYPCTCTSEEFSESKVSASLDEMKVHWASYTGQDDTFWGHEWSKHGTCCDSTQGLEDQASYFAGGLKLRNQDSLLSALSKASITPGGSYTYAAMADAIKAVIGVAPLMGCKTGNTLSEVGVCYSKTLEAIECDDSVKSQSGDEVSDCDSSVKVVFPSASGPSPSPPSPSSGKCATQGCKFTAGAPCQCNDGCDNYDDCCPDYKTVCGGPSPPRPPSPTPPTPSTGKCVTGQHGPKCSADSDCTQYSDCIRCASSGYCTNVPK